VTGLTFLDSFKFLDKRGKLEKQVPSFINFLKIGFGMALPEY